MHYPRVAVDTRAYLRSAERNPAPGARIGGRGREQGAGFETGVFVFGITPRVLWAQSSAGPKETRLEGIPADPQCGQGRERGCDFSWVSDVGGEPPRAEEPGSYHPEASGFT